MQKWELTRRHWYLSIKTAFHFLPAIFTLKEISRGRSTGSTSPLQEPEKWSSGKSENSCTWSFRLRTPKKFLSASFFAFSSSVSPLQYMRDGAITEKSDSWPVPFISSEAVAWLLHGWFNSITETLWLLLLLRMFRSSLLFRSMSLNLSISFTMTMLRRTMERLKEVFIKKSCVIKLYMKLLYKSGTPLTVLIRQKNVYLPGALK